LIDPTLKSKYKQTNESWNGIYNNRRSLLVRLVIFQWKFWF